jgi:hypothetical protein
MNEELLHYVWKFQLFNLLDLMTTEHESVQVIKSGSQNFDAGPDFFNGQVKIGATLWVGNIEIHTKSSHWFLHKHQFDENYSKIILHVVWEDDQSVVQQNGQKVPTIELKGLIQKSVFDKYDVLQNSRTWIPCESEIGKVDQFTKVQVIERMMIDRLETKSNRLNQILSLTKNDWEASLFQLLAKYFGFKVNAVPFELLATSIDFNIIRKYRNNEKQLLALLFGQAGFLNENLNGNFPQELNREYLFLANKHQLHALGQNVWKFMRMRPSNFPTIRIAQFASIFANNLNLFQSILEAESVDQLYDKFKVSAYEYFNSHYQFDIPAAKNEVKYLGKSSVDVILINVVIPLLFNYGRQMADETIQDRALSFLQEIKWEKNAITKKWKDLGMPISTAYDSQALIQLKNENCSNKKCLSCAIGTAILKPDKND